jgi:anti-sigma factor (TIGR02949 family)
MSTQDSEPSCGEECSDALERLEAFLDGELPNTDVEELRDHLTACYPCTERASFEEQLRTIVRQGCAEEAPPRLVGRIRAVLDDGAVPGDGLARSD